ncbi:MAG TPA: hypothetical protein VD793_02590 [Gemmatimonadales bacterium]|nr:hypothetical protein [Gemmatimonadales bacterium]
MRRAAHLLAASALLLACGEPSENTATCGFASIAAGSMVLQSLANLNMVVSDPPPNLPAELPARVIGYGTARSVVGESPDGVMLGYEGDGFPPVPGFGLLLVDDSTETPRGVLIYETEPPGGYPRMGTVAGAAATIPLFGLRVHWPSLNAPKCPLFATRRDST